MKRVRRSLAAAAAACLWIAGSPAFADTIKIAADEWCPYNCAQDAPDPGYIIEIAQKVFAAAGHQVEYTTVNWSRALQQARAGRITALAGTYKVDAPDFVFPDEPQGSSVDAFFVRSDSGWSYAGPGSLAGIKLGYIKDYKYSKELDAYIAKNQSGDRVQASYGDDALEKNTNKLLAGRIDVVIENENVFMLAAKKKGISARVKKAGELKPIPLYLAFSPAQPKSKEYARILSSGIRKLRASGELAAILKKYGMADWKQPQ